jgi:subtilisin family serine protease
VSLLARIGVAVTGALALAGAAHGAKAEPRAPIGGDVVVAVVDSGADLRHPALRGALWHNPGEIPGNGIDDDGNGFVDDVHGADLVDGDGEPQDENGHGTHVAGLVRPGGRVRLMVVRTLDERNGGTTETAARGVDFAVRHGARVINLSFNGNEDDDALEAALGRAAQAGVLVVTSAGNDGRDLGARPSFPACSPLTNVLGVGALTRGGRPALWSNRGRCVDVAAPGVDVRSARLHGGFARRSGTSQAAPQVAGRAARLLVRRPRMTVAQLSAALRRGS